MKKGSIAFLCALVTANASALTESDLVNCRNETDNTKRLACYDALSVEKSQAPSEVKWVKELLKSEFDDSQSVIAAIESDEEVDPAGADNFKPSLIVRCHEGKLDVFMILNTFITAHRDEGMEVTTRVDSEKAVTEKWRPTQKNDGIMSNNPEELVKSLNGKSKLIMRIPVPDTDIMTPSFAITGFDSIYQDIKTNCKLK